MQALPMRLRAQVIGALNLFQATPGGLGHEDVRVGQALAERLGLDMDQAFTTLRAYARGHNLRLSDLAQAFIDGTTPPTSPASPPQPAPDRTKNAAATSGT